MGRVRCVEANETYAEFSACEHTSDLRHAPPPSLSRELSPALARASARASIVSADASHIAGVITWPA